MRGHDLTPPPVLAACGPALRCTTAARGGPGTKPMRRGPIFAQAIQSRTQQPDRFVELLERWAEVILPSAPRLLSLVAGYDDQEGATCITTIFESEAAAKAHARRTDQARWWQEMAVVLDTRPETMAANHVTSWLTTTSSTRFSQLPLQLASVEVRDEDMYFAALGTIESLRRDVHPGYHGGCQLWFPETRSVVLIREAIPLPAEREDERVNEPYRALFQSIRTPSLRTLTRSLLVVNAPSPPGA